MRKINDINKKAMSWTKFILFFQAVVTLIIGTILFMQVMTWNEAKVEKFEVSVGTDNIGGEAIPEFIDFKSRFTTGGFILLVVSSLEVIIITRFVS